MIGKLQCRSCTPTNNAQMHNLEPFLLFLFYHWVTMKHCIHLSNSKSSYLGGCQEHFAICLKRKGIPTLKLFWWMEGTTTINSTLESCTWRYYYNALATEQGQMLFYVVSGIRRNSYPRTYMTGQTTVWERAWCTPTWKHDVASRRRTEQSTLHHCGQLPPGSDSAWSRGQ